MTTIQPESSNLIDGKAIAEAVNRETASRVADIGKQYGATPGLAVILVGDNPASKVYVNTKVKKCAELGIYSGKIVMPKETSQPELLEVIRKLNRNPTIHGILVQSPPPPQIDEAEVVKAVSPDKDVDCFHPQNVGRMLLGDLTGFLPCTPYGVLQLLQRSGIETAGKHAVVLGRSNIVGKPIGINRVEAPDAPKGYRLVGDVAFDEVAPKAAKITPVPGGVGPMTIAMLMRNTVLAFEASFKR